MNEVDVKKLVAGVPSFFEKVKQLIELANKELAPDQQRFGGYLTILDAEDGKLLLTLACGIIPLEKAEKYRLLSLEKAQRVFNDKRYNTSWDTQDEGNAKYPGAIRGVKAIYSFSGCKSDVDEAISVFVYCDFEQELLVASEVTSNPKELFSFYQTAVAGRNQFVRAFMI